MKLAISILLALLVVTVLVSAPLAKVSGPTCCVEVHTVDGNQWLFDCPQGVYVSLTGSLYIYGPNAGYFRPGTWTYFIGG